MTNLYLEPNEIEKKQGSVKDQFITKLIEIDIATHITIAGILIVLFGMFFAVPLITQKGETNFFQSPPHTEQIQSIQKNAQSLTNYQVYAKTQVIDADRIFSFPPSEVTLALDGTPKKEVYGFFPYWMIERQEMVSLNGVTTIGLFGLETDGKGNIVIADKEGTVDGGWAMWNNPKTQNLINRARQRKIRVELVIKAFNNTSIEELVQNNDAHKTFISNVIQLINLKSLDGINLDFEYVGQPDQKVRIGFSRFITNLRLEMKRTLPNATLTVDTYVHSVSIPGIFDMETVANHSDSIIIMGYDFHTPLGEPGPIAPMEGQLGIISSISSYLEKIPSEKIILAVPYYGYDWTVDKKGESKTIPYAELAQIQKGKEIQWDDITQTPTYKYVDEQTATTRIVHFENPRSLGIKYDYVNRKNLKGIGIWALGYDGLNADLRQVILEKFSY